jgi:hypothetical protein
MPLKKKNTKNVLKNVSTNKNKINIVIDNSKKTVSRKSRTKKSNSNKPPQQINIINQSVPQQARGFDDDLRKFSNDYITPSKRVQKLIDEPQKVTDEPLIKETPPKESTVKKGRPTGSKNKEKIYASPVNSPMIFESPNVQSVSLTPVSQFEKDLEDVDNEFKDILSSMNVTDNRKERKKNSKVPSSPMTFTENPSVESSSKPRTRSPSISSYSPQFMTSPDTVTNRFSMTPRLIKVSKKDST